jgi:hypothetical protein
MLLFISHLSVPRTLFLILFAQGAARLIDLANAHPEWPFEVSMIRANIMNISRPRGATNRPAILSQNLPDGCYLQSANGTFIDDSGIPVKNATKYR